MQGVMGFLITRKPLYCKFTIESSGENMLKIGQGLTELWP